MFQHRTATALIGAVLAGAVTLGVAGTASAAAPAKAPAAEASAAAALSAQDRQAYEELLRSVLVTADSLAVAAEQSAPVDTRGYRAAFSDAFASAPAPGDNPLLDKALDGLKVQVDALVKAAGAGDLADIAVAVSGVVGSAQNVLTSGGLVASINALLKPLDLTKLGGQGKPPIKMPELPIPKIPGLG
ncbi:hypothetical protein ACFQVC_01295 [Streptomyces monticola]|uniref:Secreted protein n=1 Tax=Streptomyces monticola TaxID=2666263 RepID=A0ABW2JA14_9ACTN